MTKPTLSTRDRILELLCRHSSLWVSGEQISRELQLSRTAVWKQINRLRALGIPIEAQHARGYRLHEAPDLLSSANVLEGMKTDIIPRSLVILPATDSTNLQLKQKAEAGAEEGTVLIADQQLAGRGRLGRPWVSPAGVNIYCSLLLRPQIPVQQAPQFTFLSAVAVVDTLKSLCAIEAEVKWPNDILVDGAKIAGLLNEMSAETEQVNYIVLGIGVNLNMTADQFPKGLNYPATSALLITGKRVARGRFLQGLLERLDHYYGEFLRHGFAPIRRRWEQLCPIVNQRVQVDGRFTGTVVGLEADGALRLQLDSGEVERVIAGDVRSLK